MATTLKLLTIFLLASCWTSCEKKLPNDCYDKRYAKEHKGDPCFSVYDPVVGCDRVTYGNECEMRNNGIKKIK